MQVDSENLHVYLADFGLAKIITTVGTVSTNTSVKGTPGFQAPELFKIEKQLDVKVDIYALGCVMIELFSSHAVWEGFSPVQILFKVGVEGASPSVENVSPDNVKKGYASSVLDLVPHSVPSHLKCYMTFLLFMHASETACTCMCIFSDYYDHRKYMHVLRLRTLLGSTYICHVFNLYMPVYSMCRN